MTSIPEACEALELAYKSRRPIPPLSETFSNLTLETAYRISRQVFFKRIEGGARSIGRKIGLTSQAVQKQLGVEQPDFGFLTQDMRIANGGSIAQGALIQGRAEGEVAFVLKSDLMGPRIGREEVLRATDYVSVCIEVIDSRIQDWKIKIQDTVADNASSAFFVMGSERCDPRKTDLRMAGMSLYRNGELTSTGVGAACLNDPSLAVAWLANTLSEHGDGLKVGDIILSGAYGPIVPFNPGDRCEVLINGLGKVSCTYER